VVSSSKAGVFDALVGALVVRGEFGGNQCLDVERVAHVRMAAAAAGLNERQALSMRKLLLTERAIKTTGRLRDGRYEEKLCARYEGGESLVALSRQADIPPIAIFRAVLRARNGGALGENKMRQQLRRTLRDPERHLANPRDRAELAAALAVDAVSFTDDDDMYGQRRGAYRLERALQNFLTASNVEFLTEDQQRFAHLGEGPLPSTPDVLLAAPGGVRINGRAIHWIDAKAYFGPAPPSKRGEHCMQLWLKRTVQQARRYRALFGPGALVFALGHHEALCEHLADDAVVLDASVLGGSAVLDTPADVVVENPARRWSRDELPPDAAGGARTDEEEAARRVEG
jgi:hypothetical protein